MDCSLVASQTTFALDEIVVSTLSAVVLTGLLDTTQDFNGADLVCSGDGSLRPTTIFYAKIVAHQASELHG